MLGQITLLLLAGGVSLVIVHTMLRWYPRPWYFVVNAQSLSLAIGLFWDSIVSKAKLKLALLLTCLPLLIVFGWTTWKIGYYPWQDRQYAAAKWIRENTDEDDTIASMNSGIMGYYGKRTVVNMDGVVNPKAFEAIKERRMLNFMRTSGVDYFIDFDFALRNEYGQFMGPGYPDGLHELTIIDEEYSDLGYMRVYSLK